MAQVITKAGLALGAALDPENPERLMSQAKLARQVGVSQPSVSAWVAMSTRPEAHYRRAIQRVMASAAAERGLACDIAEDDWMTDAERAIANIVPGTSSSTNLAADADESEGRAKPTGTS